MSRLTPFLVTALLAGVAATATAQPLGVRTADPAKRGLKESDFPRTIKVADNVYTYEDFHAGPEKFTTTNMFVVTDEGVLVADGQGSPAETRGLVDAIAKVTTKPIKYVVICSTMAITRQAILHSLSASHTSFTRRRRRSSIDR